DSRLHDVARGHLSQQLHPALAGPGEEPVVQGIAQTTFLAAGSTPVTVEARTPGGRNARRPPPPRCWTGSRHPGARGFRPLRRACAPDQLRTGRWGVMRSFDLAPVGRPAFSCCATA